MCIECPDSVLGETACPENNPNQQHKTISQSINDSLVNKNNFSLGFITLTTARSNNKNRINSSGKLFNILLT